MFGDVPKGVGIIKAKPLLHDLTTILIEEATGAFEGFRQKSSMAGDVDIFTPNALLFPFRVEGTNWYGEPLLENVRTHLDDWKAANDGARRYDRKVAGSHWIVYFPEGTTLVNGVETDNSVTATSILNALQSSGSVAVPGRIQGVLQTLNGRGPAESGWKIDIVSDLSSRQGAFGDRLAYIDKLLVRGLLTPERAILEGQFGTKAEASAHGDLAVIQRELEHRELTRRVQECIVDPLLIENFGEGAAGTVRVVPVPMSDDRQAWLREIYKLVLSNPSGFAAEIGGIDTDALKDAIDVPKSMEVAAGDLQNGSGWVTVADRRAAAAGVEFPGVRPETKGQKALAASIHRIYRDVHGNN